MNGARVRVRKNGELDVNGVLEREEGCKSLSMYAECVFKRQAGMNV